MAASALLWTFLVFGFQEEKKNFQAEESIVVVAPDPYSHFLESLNSNPQLLNLPPKGIKRKYLIKIMSPSRDLYETKELEEFQFYHFANRVLYYGVLDTADSSYHLNSGYRNFIRTLLRHMLIDLETLAYLGKLYLDPGRNWIESAYCLDDVIPGIIPIQEWDRIACFYSSKTDSLSRYFRVLASIKKGDPVNGIRGWLDTIIQQQEYMSGEHFKYSGKAYAELIRKGAIFPEFAQIIFFKSYLNSDPWLRRGISKSYATIGLPLPKKKIIQKALLNLLKAARIFDESVWGTVSEFRIFEIELPRDLAESYRDELLKNYQDLDDILFLIKCAGEDGDPALWKKYADFNFRMYKCKEDFLSQCKDTGYYYHAAIEGYRRAVTGGIGLNSNIGKALLKAEDDPSVHVRDLIIAYELAGYDPRCKILVEKLEGRVELASKNPAGVFFDEDDEIDWQKNEYDGRIVPFREEIELTAYLNDPERTRDLSKKITRYALERLRQEGPELLKKFRSDSRYYNCRKYWLDSVIAFEMLLRNLDTPIYVELAAIIDVYESLGFKDGARSLAQHLLGDAGFYIPARRAFQVGGFGERAEEVLYCQRDDSYWLKMQSEFSAKVRRKAILKR